MLGIDFFSLLSTSINLKPLVMAQNEKTYQVRFTLKELEQLHELLKTLDENANRKYENESKRLPDRLLRNQAYIDQYTEADDEESAKRHYEEREDWILGLQELQKEWIRVHDLRWEIAEKLNKIYEKI